MPAILSGPVTGEPDAPDFAEVVPARPENQRLAWPPDVWAAVLGVLPDGHRRVFVWFFFDDLSRVRIARRLGCRPAAGSRWLAECVAVVRHRLPAVAEVEP